MPTIGLSAATACVAAAVVTVALVPGSDADYWRRPDAVEAAGIDPVGTGELAPLVPVSTVPSTSTPTTSPAVTSTSATPSSESAITPTSNSAPGPSTTTSTTLAPLPQLSRPMRVLVAGDSTAEATGFGLAQWATERPDLAQVSLLAEKGCGFLRGGEQRIDDWVPVPDRCDRWLTDDLTVDGERRCNPTS